MESEKDQGYRLAYEEGRRTIDQQAATLREVRDRAGTLVSVAGVVAGVATVFARNTRLEDVDALGAVGAVVAGAGFVCVVVAVTLVWNPVKGVFALDAGVIVGSYVEGDPPAGTADIHRDLALHLGRHARRNADVVERRLHWFRTGLAGLMAEVLGIVVLVTSSR